MAFDNSKDTLAVAIVEGGLRGEVRFWGTIPNQPEAVRDADHEAVRELIRGWQTAMQEVRRSRQLVSSFLLRHDRAMPTRRGGRSG